MALLNQYRGFTTGQIYEMSYSPKGLSKLEQYDRRPLFVMVNYDNVYRLLSGLNLHWVSVDARKAFFKWIYKRYNIKDLSEWGRPINFTWQHVVSYTPWMAPAWRRYFPQRIRNIIPMATTYALPDIMGPDVVQSDTAKIIGVTPEVIQRHYQLSKQRAYNASAQRHREALQKSLRVSPAPKPKAKGGIKNPYK